MVWSGVGAEPPFCMHGLFCVGAALYVVVACSPPPSILYRFYRRRLTGPGFPTPMMWDTPHFIPFAQGFPFSHALQVICETCHSVLDSFCH